MNRPVQQAYPVKVHTGIRVVMRDGVELNVRITRPDALGRFQIGRAHV
jgi:predicted acyl esterase